MYWKIWTAMPGDAKLSGIKKTPASFYIISLTQIFFLREQKPQDDNEADAIFFYAINFFCHAPVRVSFCCSLFRLTLIFLHANNVLITPTVITSEV